jgi:hypothetical protein
MNKFWNGMTLCIGFGALIGALSMASMQTAEAAATCFCKISKDNLTGSTGASGVCQDITSNVNTSYTGINQQSQANQTDCNDNHCRPVATGFVGSQAVATACCNIGAANGTTINAYSAVGTKAYRLAWQIGVLTNTPAVIQKKCPVGWLANPTNVDGGVTSDGKCKKQSGTLTITPFPPNGTPIGTYGFTWGNGVYAWGTAANGGAAVITTITAAACHF